MQDFKTKRLSRQKDSVFSCLEDKDEKKEDDDKETDIEEAKENKDFVCIESESEEEEKEIPTKAADVSYGSGASSGEAVTETKRQQQQRNLQRQHTVGLSKKFKRDLGEFIWSSLFCCSDLLFPQVNLDKCVVLVVALGHFQKDDFLNPLVRGWA